MADEEWPGFPDGGSIADPFSKYRKILYTA